MSAVVPYNPLDKKNLGESVADALLRSASKALSALRTFDGAGIYAIYYTGGFPAYRLIAEKNSDGRLALPIYVGKAVPSGARKGGFGLGRDPGSVLFKRLMEHARSINQVENLNLEDFYCRFLVVDDIWIPLGVWVPLGESLLIAKFSPLWNRWLDGFGNHDPGKGRYRQERSRWDVLHPGRPFALNCAARRESVEQITTDVKAHLRDMYQ